RLLQGPFPQPTPTSAAENEESQMEDFIILASRTMMSAFFIVYASSELLDVRVFASHPATQRFMNLVASGTASPVWFAYGMAGTVFVCGLGLRGGFHRTHFPAV